jgi:two-component system response regulator
VPQEADLPIIVIADDDPAHRLLTVKAFERCGLQHRIHQVADGEALLDYLLGRGRPPAEAMPRRLVILLDLNMPRKSGLEILAEIKAHDLLRRIPVVVLTTSGEERDVVRAYELGASAFISKPVDFEEFSAAIRRLGEYWLRLVTPPPLALGSARG